VVSVTDPLQPSSRFIDRSRYFFLQVAPQLYSRGWVDPVPDSLLLRKSGSAGNRIRTSLIGSQDLAVNMYSIGKVKLSLCLVYQALSREGAWGSGCMGPISLTSGTRLCRQFLAPSAFLRWKKPPFPFGYKTSRALESV
jgi:hypothetical protein